MTDRIRRERLPSRAARACGSLMLAMALASALLAGLPAAAQDWAGDSEWNVVPDSESNQPGVQRDGTLRVVRFRFDGASPLEDQGTVVGWANAAATGTLVERRDEGAPEEALLEIVREKPAPAAPAPAE